MQADDGEFYNFIDARHRINISGKTSRKSFWFWAGRGYWVLGYGFKIFKDIDPAFAHRLKTHFLQCKYPLHRLLVNYGQTVEAGGKSYPAWLMNVSGSDATSEFLLGIAHYLEVEQDEELIEMTGKLVEAILAMQLDDESDYSGAFLSWRGIWHAYSNCQTQALARLGQILDEPDWIAAAEYEAFCWYSHLIDEGFIRLFELGADSSIERFPQIAYDIRPVVVGLLELYNSTGNKLYAQQAGLAASWLFGRNPAEQTMYDTETGRCFDGINDVDDVNLNSGAESTIEALYVLVEIAGNQAAHRTLMEWIVEHD